MPFTSPSSHYAEPGKIEYMYELSWTIRNKISKETISGARNFRSLEEALAVVSLIHSASASTSHPGGSHANRLKMAEESAHGSDFLTPHSSNLDESDLFLAKHSEERWSRIRSEVRRLYARTNPMKATVIVAVLTEATSKSVDTAEVEKYWGATGEPTPKNLNRDIREAIHKGWLEMDRYGQIRLDEDIDSLADKPAGFFKSYYRKGQS